MRICFCLFFFSLSLVDLWARLVWNPDHMMLYGNHIQESRDGGIYTCPYSMGVMDIVTPDTQIPDTPDIHVHLFSAGQDCQQSSGILGFPERYNQKMPLSPLRWWRPWGTFPLCSPYNLSLAIWFTKHSQQKPPGHWLPCNPTLR